MSSNQLMNHVEAVAWVRNGPTPPEGGYAADSPPAQTIRSSSGFENRIALIGGAIGNSPVILLLLDRKYSRSETAVICTPVATGDYDIPAGLGVPVFAVYPEDAPVLNTLPVNRQGYIDPSYVPPTDPIQLREEFEVYDAILVSPRAADDPDVPRFSDFCVAVIRMPKLEGETEIIPIVSP